jgi:hypothetical protein
MERGLRAPLRPHEEVTLRRVALGISKAELLPARDVAHLIRLCLIDEKDGRTPQPLLHFVRRYQHDGHRLLVDRLDDSVGFGRPEQRVVADIGSPGAYGWSVPRT